MAELEEDVIDVEGLDEKECSPLQEDAVLFTEHAEKQKSKDGNSVKSHSNIWDKFGVPFCDWPVDAMDEDSHLVIANMLHEERQYLGFTHGPINKRCKKKHPRWTTRERQQFEKATIRYGNRWTEIAKVIPSRTPRQIRNYARYYLSRKAKPSLDVNIGKNQQDARTQDEIHSHLPTSLNTALPTVPTCFKHQSMRRIPQSTKRRYFRKFGFANLSSARLKRKSRPGKEVLASGEMPKRCSVRGKRKMTLEGQRASKIGRMRKPKHRGGERLQTKFNHEPNDISEVLKNAVGANVLFEQGGGVIRMRPESSEDEDVDVEDAGIEDGGKCSLRSLIGLATTCDRIYNNLIAPASTNVQGTSSKQWHSDSKQNLKRARKRSKVKELKVIPAEVVIPELAWNADHTYSMSLRTQHRLGLWTGSGTNLSKRPDESSHGQDSARGLRSRSVSDSQLFVGDSEENMSESDVSLLKSNSYKESSDDLGQEEEEIWNDSEKDISEHELAIDLEESLECNMNKDQRAFECDRTGALDSIKGIGTNCHTEMVMSEDDDVILETLLVHNELDDFATGQLQAKESKRCAVLTELESPLIIETPLKDSGMIQETKVETWAEVTGLVHQDDYRGAAVDEGKRQTDNCDGEDQEIGNLTHEKHLKLNKIKSWEKLATPEFFEGRSAKTPERYLKIRNYIYQQWLQTKPRYLNKAAVRSGLKSCGDVNSIGRIHQSLERAGAINFGVENPNQTAITCRAKAIRQRLATGGNHDNQPKIRESKRVHKKKDVNKEAIFAQTTEEKVPLRKSVRTGLRRSRLIPYDPFKLIKCCKFTEEKRAPFHVRIQSDAMTIMDVHAHLSLTEVIGLLGGRFLDDSATLDVLLAVPCNSISTGMQCEMDPVSQTEAYESILAKGYQVVGWYHSHPAFPANPSVRDIETQSEFQGWFSQGGAPFIGVIVSPCHNHQISQSKVCCLTIGEWSAELKCRKPYQFDFAVSHSHCDSVQTMMTIAGLVTKFSSYQYRTEMMYPWTKHFDFIFLEKMLRSIRTYRSPGQQDNLLKQIKDLITAEFTTKTTTSIQDDQDK